MDFILNGCTNLAERFAHVDAFLEQKEMVNTKNDSEKILPAIIKGIQDNTAHLSEIGVPSVTANMALT